MEMKRWLFVLSLTATASCSAGPIDTQKISEVYVADFHSDDTSCRPSDVDLDHNKASQFFLRSKQIDARTLHDHYDIAPCYIEGTLKQAGKSCSWKIFAGATGEVSCIEKTDIYACDDCGDLFETQ